MNRIEFIKNNFLGIEYHEQQHVLEYLMKSLKDEKIGKVARKFNNKFNDYLDRIRLLLEFKEKYKDFNSNNRRLIRKIFLEELKETVCNHKKDYSKEQRKHYFNYPSQYYGEYKILFEAKPVSLEEIKQFLIDYSNLDRSKKIDFIEDMIFLYDRISLPYLPLPNNILDDYKSIVQSIIGDDLMKYYNCLYTEEQILLILKLINEFSWFKYDSAYYDRQLKHVKESPKIIRVLKKETIDCCLEKFS